MTSISTALSLVDTVGQVAARPTPSIAVSADSGFDAVFARILEQPDGPASSTAADEQATRPAERAGGDDLRSSATTSRDRVRPNDDSDEVAASESTEPTAEGAESIDDEEDLERSTVTDAVPVMVAVAPGAVPTVPTSATTPTSTPGIGAVAPAGAPAAVGAVPGDAAQAGPAATTPEGATTLPGAAATLAVAGDIAVEQSIAVPAEPVTEVIAALQAEGVAPTAGPTTEPASGASGLGEVTGGTQAPTTDAAAAAGAGTGGQPGAGDDGSAQTSGGNQTTVGEGAGLGQMSQVPTEVPVEPVAASNLATTAAGAADDASPPSGPSSDVRSSSSPVASVTASGPTTTERVEASTVRTAAAEAQRPVDGRLRDRFVGSGLGASMTIDLSDEGLGQLSMQAHQGGGALHVTLAAGESSTRELLLGQSATLRSELEASGTRLGSFDVTDQLPRDGGRGTRGEDASGRAATDSTDRRSVAERGAAGAPAAAARRPLSARSAGSAGIDLLI